MAARAISTGVWQKSFDSFRPFTDHPSVINQALAPPLRCHMAVSVEIASHNVYLGSALYLVEKPRS